MSDPTMVTEQTTARDRYYRNLEAIESKVGTAVLQRDENVAARARLYARREDFDLTDCLADMVKGLAEDKKRITNIASELIQRHGA